MSVRYTDPALVTGVKITDVPTSGQTASGYGGAIPTRYMIRYGSHHWRRVYAMVYANSGSVYIRWAGEELFLDTDTEHRLWGA